MLEFNVHVAPRQPLKALLPTMTREQVLKGEGYFFAFRRTNSSPVYNFSIQGGFVSQVPRIHYRLLTYRILINVCNPLVTFFIDRSYVGIHKSLKGYRNLIHRQKRFD